MRGVPDRTPLWVRARNEVAFFEQHAVGLDRSEPFLGTPTQVFAALVLQDWWRRILPVVNVEVEVSLPHSDCVRESSIPVWEPDGASYEARRDHCSRLNDQEPTHHTLGGEAAESSPRGHPDDATDPDSDKDGGDGKIARQSAWLAAADMVEIEVAISLDDCWAATDAPSTAEALVPESTAPHEVAAVGRGGDAAISIKSEAPRAADAEASPSEHGGVAQKEMVVARGIEDVFSVVSDVEAYPRWVRGLDKVDVHERDEDGHVLRAEFTVGAMGLKISYVLAYTIERPFRLAWVSVAGGVKHISGHYKLSPTEDGKGTVVQYVLSVDTGFKMPGLLRRTATGLVISAALPDLKRHLEATPPDAPNSPGRAWPWS